jgi:hypothetical protein
METTTPISESFHQSAEQIRQFVSEIESYYMLERARPSGMERRDVERVAVTMPVQMTRLDETFVPLRYQYHAVTRDISPKGVGLVTTNPVALTYVLLTFQPYYGEAFNAIGRINRCEELGYYFSVGCEFLIT